MNGVRGVHEGRDRDPARHQAAARIETLQQAYWQQGEHS